MSYIALVLHLRVAQTIVGIQGPNLLFNLGFLIVCFNSLIILEILIKIIVLSARLFL